MKTRLSIMLLLLLAGNSLLAQNYNDRWKTNDYFPTGHFIKDDNDRWESRAGEVAYYMCLAGLPSWRDSLAPKDVVRLRVSMKPEYSHPLFVTVELGEGHATLQMRRGDAICGYVEYSTYYEMSDTGFVDVTETKNHDNVWVKGYHDNRRKTIDSASLAGLQSVLLEANLPKHSPTTCLGGFQPAYVMEYMDSRHYNAIYDECYDGALGKLVNMIMAMADSSCADMTIYSSHITPAEFPGGDTALQEFIASTMIYPELALADGEEASIYLYLIIERDGTVFCIDETDKYNGDKYGFYKEAKRIVSLMPRWKPAIKKGKTVRSSITYKFSFKLPPLLQPKYGTPTLETSRDSNSWNIIITTYRRLLRHPQNQEYLYCLGNEYYQEFLLSGKPMTVPTEVDSFIYNHSGWDYFYDRTPIFKGAADSALNYFYRALTATDSVNIEHLINMYLPIRQLESYLHLPHNPANQLPYDTLPELHYPATYFVNIDGFDNLDSVTDYSRCLSDSYFWTQALSNNLNAAGEPVLYNRPVSPGDTVLRFAFYPSFNPPLVFRVEHTAAGAMLYWTILDYTVDEKTWQTTVYPKQGRKRLKEKQYRKLTALLAEPDFDQLKRFHYELILDGAQWCIERRTHDDFKAHFTNVDGNKYKAVYDYLTKLAGIEADYASGYYH